MSNYTKNDLSKWDFEKPNYDKYLKPIIGEIYKEQDKYFVYFSEGWVEMPEQFILNYMNSQDFTIMLERKIQRGAKALSKLINDKMKEYDKKWKRKLNGKEE